MTDISQAGSTIALEVVGLPSTVKKDRQTDFSMLPGDVGLEWAEFVGHRLLPIDYVPAFTLFRFREGGYADHQLSDGSITTGGVEQEMQRMDTALAEFFPITIHTAYISSNSKEPYILKEAHWRGSVTVHPITLSSLDTNTNIEQISALLREVNPDIVHLHAPHNCLNRALINSLPEKVGVVASDHGAPLLKSEMATQISRNYLKDFINRYQKYRLIGGACDAFKLTMIDSFNYFNRRLFDVTTASKTVNAEALKHGHGFYQAHNLSTVSEAGKRNLNNLPSIVMHPPVDPEFFSPDRVSHATRAAIRYSLSIPKDRALLFYHARICSAKGQEYLPEVIAEARKMTDRPFTLAIVGPECEKGALSRLHHQIERFAQRDVFQLIGGRSQADIRNLLGAADLGLFPSFNEGLGLTAVEMQLMRVPVVAHRVGGIPEVVRHGVTGSLVSPGDVIGFAREICQLLESSDLRREYGHHGRQLMVREFDPRQIAKRALESLYLPQILNLGRVAV